MVNVSKVSNDGRHATPIAAYCLLKIQELTGQKKLSNSQDCLVKTFEEPSHKWYNGSICTLLAYTSSYVLGFESGFDGNAPGHPACSQHFHSGYEDGKNLLNKYIEEGLLKALPDDPFKDITDPGKLDELYRVCGYRRAGHVPYASARFSATQKSAEDRRKEKLREAFQGKL